MSTTDKESIAAGTDNRPPMLEESDFDSWKIRIQRYIRGKPNGKLIWNSIKNGPTPHPTTTDTTGRECEQQTQGVPKTIFITLNQTETAQKSGRMLELPYAKDRVLSEQQQNEILFDQYERFRANGNESIYDYFVRFHKLINDMKITKIQILAHQRNTKFLNNNLPSFFEQANKTSSPSSQQYSPFVPPQSPQSTIDAMLATMNHIVNLLSGFQKHFSPTNNQLKTSTNPMTQATIQAGQITTENVQRRAPGNKGHIARECKEKKQEKDSQWFKDKALLMEAKEKGVILDAEAEAFLADVECTTPYVEPLAITTTTAFEGTSNDTDFHSEVESNKSLKIESEKLKTDNKAREDSYKEEFVWLRHTNKVVTELFQSYGQPIQTIPMLSKRPTFASKDLHKTALGRSNPKYLKTAQLSWPALYRGDIVVNPLHTPHRVHDNEDTLVHAEVSRTKMLEKMKDPECPIISSPINYAKLNNLYDTFVPQKELTREQAYWLPANEVASNQSKPAQQFVHTRPAKSQVNSHLKTLKSCFPEFDEVIKFRTKPTCLTDGEWRFEHTKRCFVEQIIPFYEKLKTHVKGIEDNLFKEVSEYMKIFDELDKEYDQCVIDKKCLEIENKNLLIQNECLLAESISKDICSVVLTPDNVVPISVEPCSNCDKEQTRNLELEAEFSKVKQLLVDKERRCSHIETEYLNLELKFQKYKECFENSQVCNNLNSLELNIFFEINRLKEQLQGKDNTIGKLKAHINNMKAWIKDDSLVEMKMCHFKEVFKNCISLRQRSLWKVLLVVGSRWKPTGRKFTLGDTCPLTRINKPEVVSIANSGSVRTSEPTNNVTVTPSLQLLLVMVTTRSEINIIPGIYYVEGLSHNLFSVGQFCDGDLEVAFRKNTCFVRNKDKVDLLKGSRTTNLYSISLKDMLEASPVCLLSKASSTKSWLWHRRLNHLNFGTLNELARKDLVWGLPKLKYKKEHLCPSCQLGKSNNALNAIVRYLRTDNGMEFVNKTLTEFCESVRITHNTSVPRTPQQNGVGQKDEHVRTLMEAACYNAYLCKSSNVPLGRSCKKPEVNYFRVFGSLCYPTNDYDDLGKLKAKADIGLTSVQSSTRLGLNSMAPEHINSGSDVNQLQSGRMGSGLVPTPTTPSVPPTEKQLSELFQPLYDEDEEFPPKVQPQLVYVAPPRAPEIAPDSPSMTTVTKDAPTATTITSPLPSSPPDTSVDELENTITTLAS
ncbi:retrovirus-related pol polyprotein from transposon TNT 1-94 [Tanacetum coccineum]